MTYCIGGGGGVLGKFFDTAGTGLAYPIVWEFVRYNSSEEMWSLFQQKAI